MANKCTLEDLKQIESELLLPEMIADVLGTSTKTLIQTAINAPESLGFPVIKIGKRVRFPRRAFIDFMLGSSSDNSK